MYLDIVDYNKLTIYILYACICLLPYSIIHIVYYYYNPNLIAIIL